jgi:hypothetical protein
LAEKYENNLREYEKNLEDIFVAMTKNLLLKKVSCNKKTTTS